MKQSPQNVAERPLAGNDDAGMPTAGKQSTVEYGEVCNIERDERSILGNRPGKLRVIGFSKTTQLGS